MFIRFFFFDVLIKENIVFCTYNEFFCRLYLILNCGRENVGGFKVHKIYTENDDTVDIVLWLFKTEYNVTPNNKDEKFQRQEIGLLLWPILSNVTKFAVRSII